MLRAMIPLIVLALAAPVHGQSAAEKKATIAYVQSLQRKDGGFAGSKSAEQGTLRGTSAAVRFFKYYGGEVPDAPAAVRFVEQCFDKQSGGFADVPGGKAELFPTAVGLMAVVQLKMPLEKYRGPAVAFMAKQARTFEDIRITAAALDTIGEKTPHAAEWLAVIDKMRQPDGTYGSGPGQARATGSAAVAVLRLGGKIDREAVLKAIKAGQRADGGYGKEDARTSDLESSYRVMRLFWMLKDRPNADKLRGFIASCRNADGGYGISPGQPSSMGATYFMSIMLHWLE